MKRSFLVVGGILLAVCVYYYVWIFRSGDFFTTRGSNAPNRTALVAVRDAVKIGASYSDVLAAYWRLKTSDLRLHADDSARWLIRMPYEFGASDWVLRIDFQDGRVAAVRVRTSDGPAPRDGPSDKQ
jgi:hypothetical protein